MDNPTKHLKYLVLMMALPLVLLLSCKTQKNLRKLPSPVRSQSEVLEALGARNINFSHFFGKADLSFDSPDQSGSGSIQVRMIRDSISWVLVKKFGLEAVRMLANPDSAFVLYRFEHICQTGRIDQISASLGLSMNFEDMQQITAGNVMLPESKDILSFQQRDYTCVLTTKNEEFALEYTFDALDLSLTDLQIKDRRGREVTIHLSDYKAANDGQIVPFKRDISYKDNDQLMGSSSLHFSEITLNEPKSITFTIPDSYERLSF